MKIRVQSPQQQGSVLLEALVAILIFSIGILAVIGLQATAINASSQAKYRSEASMLANDLIGQMYIADPTALVGSFSSANGPAYIAWAARVTAILPGAIAAPPVVDVQPNGVTTINIFWRAPGDESATARKYAIVAQIQ